MITITKEQAQSRFALLPSTLQDAIFSEQNTEIISSIGEQYHLSDEKMEGVASLVGWVLLGFLHLEDLPGEIAANIGVASQLAKDITSSLTNKIFTVIKPDLDKVYAPVPHEKIQEGPAIIQNTPPLPPPTPLIAKPTTLSDIGWSKQPAPQPTSAKIGAPIPTPPTPPKPPVEPAPMMLHEDTTFKSAEKNVSFTLSKPGGTAEMSMNRGAAVLPAPTRPAVLEFGGGATSAATSAPKPPAPTSSTARPVGFGPSFASMPTENIGTRNVSQIVPTAPAPMPPRPPQAPQTSPAPSTPQPNKPIVKDFL
jgi:hypothetical protein